MGKRDSVKYLLFDCMETLIDLTELPAAEDYALWTFAGSGSECCWTDFEEFYRGYLRAKDTIRESLPELREHELGPMLELAVRQKMPDARPDSITRIAGDLYRNFWQTYTGKCYVRDDTRQVLPELARQFPLGVVSNFVVREGIEELLAQTGIASYFSFVVTSVKEGWRKPHPRIYRAAVELARVNPGQILFVGDNYQCDYLGPGNMGFQTVLLDRYNRFGQVPDRIRDFHELFSRLNRAHEKVNYST